MELTHEQRELMDWFARWTPPKEMLRQVDAVAKAYWQQLGYDQRDPLRPNVGPRFTGR